MPIQNPRVDIVAQPLDTFARPAATNRALQLAQSLRELNPALTSFMEPIADDWVRRQFEEGRKRAIEDARDWRDAVQRNDRRLGENPWFRRAYRQQMGRNAGQQIYQEALAAYNEWEGRDSDDPSEFRHWIGTFIRERTATIENNDIISGMLPELNTLQNNLNIMHAAYTAERVEREGADAINNAVVNALRDSRDGPLDLQSGERTGDFSAQSMHARYEELRDQFGATGVSRTRFDEVYTDSVIDSAVSDLDESYLEVLNQPRGDTPPISRKAGMADRIADARNTILARSASRQVRQSQLAAAAREEQAQLAFQMYAVELLERGQVSRETQQQIAVLGATGVIDVREFRELATAWREGVGQIDNPGFPQTDDDIPPDLLLAIYEQGDVRAVVRAWNSGLITDRALFGRLIRSATDRREEEQSQGISRANLGMRQAGDQRSAISRALLPTYTEIYSEPEEARRQLGATLDAFRPARAQLIDRYAARAGVSAEAAGVAIDADVAAYIAGEITMSDFEAAHGPDSFVALQPFARVRREQRGNNRN